MSQHLDALALANGIRLARAQVKRELVGGAITIEEAFDHWAVQSMAVADLLRAQNRWGRTRARKLLSRLAIAENRPVARLTQRQRVSILAALSEIEDRRKVLA